MLQNSFIYSVFAFLAAAVKNSFIVRILKAILSAFEKAAKTSFFAGKIFSRKKAEDYAETSVFYRVLKKVSGFIAGILKHIYQSIRKFNSGSVNERIYHRIFAGSYLLRMENIIAVSVMVMMIIPHNFWNNMYALLLAFFLLAYYVLTLSSGKRMGEDSNSLWLPLLIFAFSLLMGVICSYEISDSIRVLVFFATSFILCLCVFGTLTGYERINKFTGYMYVTLIIVSLYAIMQRIMGVKPDASLTDLTLNADMPGRVFGTMGNPNNFAEFLIMFLPFGGAFALNIENKNQKTAAVILLALPLVALLSTYSRSSWISFAVSFAVFIVLWNRKTIPYWLLAVICLIPFIPESIMNRILTIGNLNDTSSSYRIDIWKASLEMIKDYPVSGIGLGSGAFKSIFPAYAIGETAVAPHSHMQFLEIWIETGIIGMISFMWFIFAMVKRSAAKWQGSSPCVKTLTAAGAASMSGIIINGFFEYIWFYPRVMFAFFIVAGVIMAIIKCNQSSPLSERNEK